MSLLGLPSTEVGQTRVVPPSPSPSETPPLCSPLCCVVTYCHWFGERSLPGEFIVFSDKVHGALLHFLHDKCTEDHRGGCAGQASVQ